ncbi:MAG: exo-alpha-sialidase [Clostridia bacterium]|nr:exo-alpha-sialidase [Clostridia bacterium]
MAISVRQEILIPASGNGVGETRVQHYLEYDGLTRREVRAFISQDDTSDYTEYRDSPDNGRTWGEWKREKRTTKEPLGDRDELAEEQYPIDRNVWNPIHRHYLTLHYQTIYVGGYEAAHREYWSVGGQGPVYHAILEIRDESASSRRQPVTYEPGAAFDRETYRETDYLSTNFGLGTGLCILKNGDIIFGLWTPVDVCCRMAGLDPLEISPSASRQPNGLLVCRGSWNHERREYDFAFSRPVILDDRQSSRGISEPVFAELEGGRILAVLRASNQRFENWGSRISPCAPCYKFFCLSDDGGKTFSPPMPWHFDTREVIYSPATYSLFWKNRKNGKLYWFGNITDPTKTHGNYPRFPLCMVEVDEIWGYAKKDTLTVIDTRREGEPEDIQLSNFSLLEDRETGNFELILSKFGQYPERAVWDCDTWRYVISL